MERFCLRILRGDNRGMALLITIMVVTLLVGITVQFGRNVRQGFFASATQLEGQRLMAIARSGVAIGLVLLENDGEENGADSLQAPWAQEDPERFAGLFDRGTVHLRIEDLTGLMQINSLAKPAGGEANSGAMVNENREILNQLLVSSILVEGGEEQAREIIDSIIDWLDPDDDESEFGAESGYYRSLAVPYSCRNGPINDVGELLLVKGITPKLLYGEGGRPGLADVLTVHGEDGKMNINTMPKVLLQALHPLMTEEMAEMLDSYRRAEENAEVLTDAGWYRNVPGFPGDIEFQTAALTTQSRWFRVRSEGRLDGQVRRVVAIVERQAESGTQIVETRME